MATLNPGLPKARAFLPMSLVETWSKEQSLAVPADLSGRADKVLSEMVSGSSRTRIQQSFDAGRVSRDGQLLAKRESVKPGDVLCFQLAERRQSRLEGVNLPLDILHEDEDVLFVNKASGMVVHPGSGTGEDTLVHALLHHCGNSFSQVGSAERPGIVHRLDKGTTGVLVVAKTQEAYLSLVEQFSNRTVQKAYLAVVTGNLRFPSGSWSGPIGRHPVHRQRMTITPRGKPALTEWEVIERIAHKVSLLRCAIHTGRTHQIRVHFGNSGFPLAGDEIYGYKPGKFPNLHPPRVMLHAERLGIIHPLTGQELQLEAAPPEDFSSFVSEVAEQRRKETES